MPRQQKSDLGSDASNWLQFIETIDSQLNDAILLKKSHLLRATSPIWLNFRRFRRLWCSFASIVSLWDVFESFSSTMEYQTGLTFLKENDFLNQHSELWNSFHKKEDHSWQLHLRSGTFSNDFLAYSGSWMVGSAYVMVFMVFHLQWTMKRPIDLPRRMDNMIQIQELWNFS